MLRQRHVANLHVMVWANGAGAATVDYLKAQPVRLFDSMFNCGQNIAMNEMLDEANRKRVRYFVRVDEDCVFQTPNWLKRLLQAHQALEDDGHFSVMAPAVNGLKSPPPALGILCYKRREFEQVNILGGICRLHPMLMLRNFRFEERVAMGGGEATQMAHLCNTLGVPMLRYPKVQVSHGGSTASQEAADPVWAYEHDMLQYLPPGL